MSYSRRQLEAFGEPFGDSCTRKEGGRIVYGGGGSSSAPSSQTQITDLPDWAKPYAQETLAKTKAITEAPYQQYNAPRIAGFSPLQQQSFQGAAGIQPSQMGQFGGGVAGAAALGALGASYNPYRARNQYQGIAGYSPFQFQNQFQAPQEYSPTSVQNQYRDVEAYQPTQFANRFAAPGQYEAGQFAAERVGGPQLSQYQMGPAERVRADTFGGRQASQYMSPYIEQALQPQLRELGRQSEIQRNQQQAQAVGQGAFGGSRQAIVEAERQRNLGQQQGDVLSKGYQTAYEQAQQQFNQDAARRLQAQQLNQQAGLTVGGQNLSALLSTQQLGAQTGLQAALANQQQALETQRLAEQSRQFGAGQGLTAAQLQAQYGLSADQAAEASRQYAAQQASQQAAQRAQYGQSAQQLAEQSRQFGAGQGMTAAQLQAQYGLSADQASAMERQYAYNQAMQQAAQRAQYGQSAQQLAEQSRQYGAGLGMQGLQTALQGAGQLGALGGQQFGQQKEIVGLQSQLGAQEQALRQQGLTQAYQDFLNEQNYPYKQLGFMSDMIRGLPLGQQSTKQLYEAPGNLAGQIAGIGTGLLGVSSMGRMFNSMAEGGEVEGYAEGGDVTSDYNVDDIISKLSDAQLQQARLAALNNRDQQRLEMIDSELAQRVSLRAGLGGAFNTLSEDTQNNIITAAGGGVVALAGGGDFEGVSPEFGGYSGEDRAPKARSTSEVDRIVDALRERGRTVGLSDIKDIAAGRGDYSALLAPAAPAPARAAAPVIPYDRATATRREDYEKKPSKADDGGIGDALAQIAKQTGESKRSIQDIFDRYKKSFESENADAMKSLTDLIEKSTGGSKKVKEESLGRALAEFGFKWAAAAGKPGAKFLSSAAEASPTLTASLAESAKLAREMDENDLKLRLNQKQFEIAQRTGNRKEALAAAAQERMLMQNQAQLDLRARELAQQGAYQRSSLKQRGEQFEQMMDVRKETARAATEQARTAREKVESVARQKFESDIAPRLRRELAQQYGKDWEQTSPTAQAVFAQRRNTYMRGETAGATSGVTPLSSLFNTEDLKMIGYGE